MGEVLVGRLIKRLGFTLHHTVSGLESKSRVVDQWRTDKYLKIAARAKREGALIFFTDESTSVQTTTLAKPWESVDEPRL